MGTNWKHSLVQRKTFKVTFKKDVLTLAICPRYSQRAIDRVSHLSLSTPSSRSARRAHHPSSRSGTSLERDTRSGPARSAETRGGEQGRCPQAARSGHPGWQRAVLSASPEDRRVGVRPRASAQSREAPRPMTSLPLALAAPSPVGRVTSPPGHVSAIQTNKPFLPTPLGFVPRPGPPLRGHIKPRSSGRARSEGLAGGGARLGAASTWGLRATGHHTRSTDFFWRAAERARWGRWGWPW